MTRPQHEHARQAANQIRRFRSQLRAEVAKLEHDQGRAVLADMLDDGYTQRDDVRRALINLRAIDCISWVHKMPARSADRYVTAVGASTVRTVGELTDRQRAALAGLLRGGIAAVREAEEANALELWKREHPEGMAA